MKQFRRDFPAEVPNEVRKRLLEISNAALRNGLTRQEVESIWTRLGDEHPDHLEAVTVIAAFQARIIEVGGED